MSIEDEIAEMEAKGYITVAKAAELANRVPQTIYQALKRGVVDGIEKAGKPYVSEISLAEWLKEKPFKTDDEKIAEEKKGSRAIRRR